METKRQDPKQPRTPLPTAEGGRLVPGVDLDSNASLLELMGSDPR